MSGPQTRDGFGRLARSYRLIERLAFGSTLEQARFAHIGSLSHCRHILLLGDGDGRFLQRLCREAPHARIDSVDLSTAMLARAAARISAEDRSRVTFHHADALTLQLPEKEYDGVATLFFVDCFAANEARRLIQHLSESLAPNAVWLYADFSLPPEGWRHWRARLWLWLLYWGCRLITGLPNRQLPPAEKLIQETGFVSVKTASWQHGLIRSVEFVRQEAAS